MRTHIVLRIFHKIQFIPPKRYLFVLQRLHWKITHIWIDAEMYSFHGRHGNNIGTKPSFSGSRPAVRSSISVSQPSPRRPDGASPTGGHPASITRHKALNDLWLVDEAPYHEEALLRIQLVKRVTRPGRFGAKRLAEYSLWLRGSPSEKQDSFGNPHTCTVWFFVDFSGQTSIRGGNTIIKDARSSHPRFFLICSIANPSSLEENSH